MVSSAIERRMTPRFAVKCMGELASGSGLQAVVISDLSMTGCGIELSDEGSGEVGLNGVLSITASGNLTQPVLLPVTIINCRVSDSRTRLGLQFRPLSIPQVRSLIGVIDSMIND